MLPSVAPDHTCARLVFGHTVVLVACSLLPAFYGMGGIYLAGAVLGGGWFLYASFEFARAPSRSTALASFLASLGQLSLLLLGAILDAWLLGA